MYFIYLIKYSYLIAWWTILYIWFYIGTHWSWISILWNSDIFFFSREFITLFIYLPGCQYEGHIFLPTRSKGNLHSICQWGDCKCYTASTGFLRWYSYLWGLSILPSEVIYMSVVEANRWSLVLTCNVTSKLAIILMGHCFILILHLFLEESSWSLFHLEGRELFPSIGI